MISCVFSLDYEVYGNGEGRLEDLVYAPTERLREVFRKWKVPFVPYVEAAEFEMIEARGTDEAIVRVRRQIREMHDEGSRVALHLHPQWYNATFADGVWRLDYRDYNLCTLPRERIVAIVDRALGYLRGVVGRPDFTPLAFRAGNWLFQPTLTAADVLVSRGVVIDSSVFKGGMRHEHGLDYRRALCNGYYWRFSEHADVPDAAGSMLELPIYSRMVPFWKMATAKRVGMERQNVAAVRTRQERYHRLRDLARFRHPLKLDFCRMTFPELTGAVEGVLADETNDPKSFRPLVAIGHSKELTDFETIDRFLEYLNSRGISVETFEDVYGKCR